MTVDIIVDHVLCLHVVLQAFCQRYIEIERTLAYYDPATGTSKRSGNPV